MNTPRFRTEGGGLTAALTRRVYYTAKTLHGTAGSRSAISEELSNGCVLCYDMHGHDEGVGVDATRPEDGSEGDNRGMVAGYVVGLRGPTTAAGWVNVVPFTPGTVGNPLTDAIQNIDTPTYLKTVTGSFALALADMSGSTPADEPLARCISMTSVNTDTTNARSAVCFI